MKGHLSIRIFLELYALVTMVATKVPKEEGERIGIIKMAVN
jgi:hypothetical protein